MWRTQASSRWAWAMSRQSGMRTNSLKATSASLAAAKAPTAYASDCRFASSPTRARRMSSTAWRCPFRALLPARLVTTSRHAGASRSSAIAATTACACRHVIFSGPKMSRRPRSNLRAPSASSGFTATCATRVSMLARTTMTWDWTIFACWPGACTRTRRRDDDASRTTSASWKCFWWHRATTSSILLCSTKWWLKSTSRDGCLSSPVASESFPWLGRRSSSASSWLNGCMPLSAASSASKNLASLP
mmetsp:Transcript_77215/g.202594  ORF Transcript_77215/g.202594 Transcript_77215/m.202594 type:complete len:247 (-) Transcript_77215:83-823(-)